jgi:hypothetical protein
MALSDADLSLDKEGLRKRIAQVKATYAQTERTIGSTTGARQDAAIRYLADCGNVLEALERCYDNM